MSREYIADVRMGIRGPALAVLALLAETEPEFEGNWDAERHSYSADIHTAAWYDGRERGVCVYARNATSTLYVTFGQNRSSDDIFVDNWVVSGPPSINPPTPREKPDQSYADRVYFKVGRIGDAADKVVALLKEFLEKRDA